MKLDRQLQSAREHHQAGRLAQAEHLYREILAAKPDHAETLHWLGVLALQCGKLPQAIQLLNAAVQRKPRNAIYVVRLGDALGAASRFDHAAAAYRQATTLEPGFLEAHHNLGNLLKRQGRAQEAAACYRQVMRINPNIAEAHYNLGDALGGAGQFAEAAECFRRTIALRPQLAEAHAGLASALHAMGDLDGAITAYHHAIRLKPAAAEYHNNLGNAYMHFGRPELAEGEYRETIRLRPELPEPHNNLGDALRAEKHFEPALASLQTAIQLKPDYAEAYSNLAYVLCEQRRLDEAVAACKRAIQLRPNFPEAWNMLGSALRDGGMLNEAIDALRTAHSIDPSLAEVHNNLGITLQEQGHITEAISHYAKALELNVKLSADFAKVYSNMLLCIHYLPQYTPEFIFQQHLRWSKLYAEPLAGEIKPHANLRDPDRPLRIGYVSPDFRRHSVNYFIEPLLAAHDKAKFQVFCYADELWSDSTTERMKSLVHGWRDISRMSDSELAEQVRLDGIDIFVDLVGHTAHSRLLAFARKPAPVQVTYLGYADTTGMATMDYRLTDAHADPPGLTDSIHTEELVRLPDLAWCYQPPEESLDLEPQSTSGEGITFGSFNILSKITPEVVELWAKILREIPNSKLMLKSRAVEDPAEVRDGFIKHGIKPDRLIFRGREPSYTDHLRLYGQIDMMLDPFPYHGTTTTCEALWMGAPVITLAGETHVARVGVSLLNAVGLPELIASTTDDYLRIAKDLASNRSRLSDIKTSLRPKMRDSSLMNAPQFAQNVESAYRRIWRTWCERT